MDLVIRRGTPDDAAGAVAVLRRAITELCIEDHGGDPAVLDDWLANKTVADWCVWADHPGVFACVAERGASICGVGLLRRDGTVLLNYVDPGARFSGVSTALLAAMEAEAWRCGLSACTLDSTRTALRFYLSRGYRADPQDASGLRLHKAAPDAGG